MGEDTWDTQGLRVYDDAYVRGVAEVATSSLCCPPASVCRQRASCLSPETSEAASSAVGTS